MPRMTSRIFCGKFCVEQDIDKQMEQFLREARDVLASGGEIADLKELAADETSLVVAHARLFKLLRADAASAISHIKLLATAQWLLALAVLVVALLLIVRPMALRTAQLIHEMRRARTRSKQEAATADAAREGQASFIRTMNHELRTRAW